MAQKLAPAEKNSIDISAASAAFCISVLRQIVLKLKPFRIFAIVINDHPLMIQNLANVAISFYPGERVVQSQEDQVEEGGLLMFHWEIKC